MKKNLLFVSVMLSIVSFGQKADCTKLETELQNVKSENAELIRQNIYFKESLELLKPVSKAAANNLEFTVTGAKGNKKDKTLIISYLYENTSDVVRGDYQGMSAYIVDDRGNQTKTYEVLANKEGARTENIQPGIPMKGFIKFKMDETDFPVIKMLSVDFSFIRMKNDPLSGKVTENIAFKNIPVIWE